MKSNLLLLTVSFFIISCNINTEVSQDASIASEEFISNFLKGEYEEIYEDGSIEMKSYVSEDVFLNVNSLQRNIYGEMKDAKLQNELRGKYKSSSTNIYKYTLTNKEGETFTLTTEFLKGHLLKSHMDAPAWGVESSFTKSLVEPIADLVQGNDFAEIHSLLDEKYPLEQVESLIQKIAATCDGIPNKYESTWVDNDSSGRMLVAFVYAYEGVGYLDYRFYVEDSDYPFAGIYLTPDSEIKLP